jgi:phosphoribosylanthranilate isomerase
MDNGQRTPDNSSVRTRIKICGITRPEDALLSARHGADAIGIICYPKAKRFIPFDVAKQILHALPAFVSPVALFVDQDVEEIRETATRLRLRHVQLHGHETPEMVAALREFTVLKALRAARETLAAELDLWREAADSLDLSNLQGFVMETPSTQAPGGTGVENDWPAIADLQQRGAIAAGGLNPANVAAVVRQLRPFAVDVSSGVEELFGQKSEAKLAAFTEQVRQSDSSSASAGTRPAGR